MVQSFSIVKEEISYPTVNRHRQILRLVALAMRFQILSPPPSNHIMQRGLVFLHPTLFTSKQISTTIISLLYDTGDEARN